jgi:hypothetical protein
LRYALHSRETPSTCVDATAGVPSQYVDYSGDFKVRGNAKTEDLQPPLFMRVLFIQNNQIEDTGVYENYSI